MIKTKSKPVLERLNERIQTGKSSVREIIGRVAMGVNLWAMNAVSLDKTRINFGYWDRFRRGLVPGAELAGLFVKPAAEIKADWIMGDGVEAVLDTELEGEAVDYTNNLLARFLRRTKAQTLTMVQDLKSLGEQYVIVNPDGSLSIPSPEMCEMEYDLLDYRRPVKCTVTSNMGNYTVTDEYRLDGRTMTIKSMSQNLLNDLAQDGYTISADGKTAVKTFENLIGRLPVVHFANDRSANEIHGRPQHEALVQKLLGAYDGVLDKGLTAAEVMSNPIPVFSGLEDIEDMLDANKEPTDETYTDDDGVSRTRDRLTFDRFATILLYGDEKFDFVSPLRGFTEDIKGMLKLLFLLVLEHLRIPEVVWGGELGQARASAGEQMLTFYKHIDAQRLALEGSSGDEVLGAIATGGMYEVLDIFLRYRALVDRKVLVLATVLKWPALTTADDDQNRQWAEAMHRDGVITDETYVTISGRVENPAAEVDAARKAGQDRQAEFDKAVDAAANAADASSNTNTDNMQDAAA